MSYFDYFTRPNQHYSVASYRNRLVAETEETEFNESAKYQTLFADSFGHHVQFNLDTPPTITLQLNNITRFITSDSLTSYFLDNLYTPPNIYLSQNTKLRPADKRTFKFFLDRISDTPVTRVNVDGDTEGSNLMTFLVGDVGTGKTLLLCKAVRELKRRERESIAKGEHGALLLPVYFDFEIEMRGDGGQLLDIDDAFYGKIVSSIFRSIEQTHYIFSRLGARPLVPESEYPTNVARLISLVRQLHKSNLRILLILDNLDGYHYHYSKYTFFPQYHRQLVDSIQRNITGLTTAVSHGEQLGMLGLSIVIAARRYVYQDCMHTRSPEASAEFSGAVFQLDDADEVEVVTRRLALFEAAITKIESEPRLKKYGEDYKKTLSRLRLLFGIRDAAQTEHVKPISASAMKTLRQLCHHGNRDLIAFLSNLRLDHKEETELIERFFWDKPHTLILLYIADLCERYTQAHEHFPNLFLVDALALRDPDFPEAHLPHVHTYWLKYFMLAYVASRPDGIANTSQIRRLFVDLGKFEENLVRLTLGSLSTSRQSRCLEPEAGEKTIPSNVATTSRGRFLVSNWEDFGTPFCFSFTYLQLVVDDYLLSYPNVFWQQIYARDTNLEYLFSSPSEYGRSNRTYLEKKMKNVLAFLFLLRVSLEAEKKKRPELFNELSKSAPSIVPNFDALEISLMEQYRRILNPPQNWHTVLADLDVYASELQRDKNGLRKAIGQYFEAPRNIDI
jgi:hypothetical protein